MKLSVLGDEHVEPQALTYIEGDGHEVAHVVDVLSPSVDDDVIAEYARKNDQIILTNDTDFLAFDPDAYAGLFYYPDDRLSAYEIASIVSRIVAVQPDRDALHGTAFLTREWL